MGITPLPDIEDRADCERLVRAFYGRALQDPIIGWIFTDVAELDLEEHVPKIASFWETVLLGAKTYTGGAFHPHAALHARVPLRPGHFQRWIALWRTTVDALFAGERADEAKRHADRLAFAFQGRLRTLTPPAPAPPSGGGLSVTRHGPAEGDGLSVTRHGPGDAGD
ncbi:group III truncated hemoglobin [Patulibacter sp. NPDC049589]|uniref:group III truncated hemoglobin n=1 Tax=Patulibacter sp. NPDC049589 TaxID=3154731 RepID=UPI0034259169